MTHYICNGGCDGESSVVGVCQAEGCEKEGEPLTPCNCEDGSHEESTDAESEVSEEQK